MKSLRQGYGGKTPIVPPCAASQKESSQGAKRYLTIEAARGSSSRHAQKASASSSLTHLLKRPSHPTPSGSPPYTTLRLNPIFEEIIRLNRRPFHGLL